MELTKEQLRKLYHYINSCGIKYYDVKMEVIDHFASILEEELEEKPNLNFKEKIVEVHKNFGEEGLNGFLDSKRKSINKRFLKSTYKYLKTFFKLPKIIFSISVFYALFLIMNQFKDKESFFTYISGVCTLILLQLLLRVKGNYTENKFLLIDRTENFLGLTFLLFYIGIIQTNNIRSTESFSNSTYNVLELGFFIFFLLIYWSGEYVYYQNKKEIKKQYPGVII